MTVYAFTSTRGAPGVTATTLGMALVWPKPVIVVEADVSGSSSIIAGHLGGRLSPEKSLVNLAVAHRYGSLTTDSLHEQTYALNQEASRLIIPGLVNRAQASSLGGDFWTTLGSVLRAMHRAGFDVLVDAGRLGQAGGPEPLIGEADLAVVVTRTQLDPLINLKAHEITNLTNGGLTGVILVGPGQPYTAGQITKLTGLPVWADVADDQVHAQAVMTGRLTDPERGYNVAKFERSSLIRSMRSAGDALQSAHREHRKRLEPDFVDEEV